MDQKLFQEIYVATRENVQKHNLTPEEIVERIAELDRAIKMRRIEILALNQAIRDRE